MNAKERNERVVQITSRWLDQQATGDELKELNQILRGDPEACESYLDIVESHAALTFEISGIPAVDQIAEFGKSESAVFRSLRKSRVPSTWFAVAAVAAILATCGLLWKDMKPPVEPLADGGVAVLNRLVDVAWPAGSTPLSEGDTLTSGEFYLLSGLAQIEFFSGASVIVEGPAKLELLSEWKAICRSGRLLVSVPEPARGFSVETRDYRAVDLGTEFAISVTDDGKSEVHVLDGEVRLDNLSGAEIQRLTTGMGVRHENGFEAVSNGTADFVTRRQLMIRARDDWQSRYTDWTESRQRLRGSADMVALLDFENQHPWDRQLINRAREKSSAAIIGAQWTEGRWPGKGALEFKRISDRVRIAVPGEFEALTLAASVRIEGLERWLSSLLLTDGYDRGEIHWQVSDKGELILGVAGGGTSFSPAVIDPRDLGSWCHLAVTIDRKTQTVCHYVDGVAVSAHQIGPMPPLRIGQAEIGNRQPIDRSKPHSIRSFNGRIDEVLIFNRAFTAEDIKSLIETRS